jgi:hypothetical protein
MLGTSYPGYYRLGDERALAHLISNIDYAKLKRNLRLRRHLFTPAAERQSLLSTVAKAI